MSKRKTEPSEGPSAKRSKPSTLVRKPRTTFMHIPEDVQERIFSYNPMPDVLICRQFADAHDFVDKLRHKVPAIGIAFRTVHFLSPILDNRLHDLSAYQNHMLPSVKMENVIFMITNSTRLRFVLLPNLPGSAFLHYLVKFQDVIHRDGPVRILEGMVKQWEEVFIAVQYPPNASIPYNTKHLHGIQELAYTDDQGADVAPFLSSLKKIHLWNPRKSTLRKLLESGVNIHEVWLEEVREEVMETVKELLLTRSEQLSSVSVILRCREGEARDAMHVEQVLLDMIADFITLPHDQLPKLVFVKLGPMSNVGARLFYSLPNPRIRLQIDMWMATIDPLGMRYPFSHTTLIDNPEPRSLSFRHCYLIKEAVTVDFPCFVREVVMENLDKVEDCIRRELCCPQAADGTTDFVRSSMISRCPPQILRKKRVANRLDCFQTVQHLSVRVWTKGSIKAAHTILLGLLWFLVHAPHRMHIEVTKEFVKFPQMINERKKNYLWWEPLRVVDRVFIRHKIRPVTFEGLHANQPLVCDFEFVKALPDFINLITRACPSLHELMLESSGSKMHILASPPKAKVVEALDRAISVLEVYQRINRGVCVGSVKAQLRLWKDHELQR